MSLSRREALRALGAGVLFVCAPAACGRRGGDRLGEAARSLAATRSRRVAARAVGEHYLAGLDRPPDLPALLGELLGGMQPAWADEAEAQRFVADCHARDFAEGRIADVDGWWLSETEARLCALVALVDG